MTDDDLLPPADPRTVLRTGLVGFGLSAAAAALGGLALALGDSTPGAVHTLRLLLVAAGGVLAGAAVSLRPSLWQPWAVAAGAFGLAAVLGVPAHWDSGQLLARVLAGAAVVGAVLVALPLTPRLSVVSLAAVFHFSGILAAVTWPDPGPWLTTQLGNRVYMPYLSFLYLRNAYHFYSPEPGPASILACLLKYETDETDPATGKPKVLHEWVVFPKRDEHMRDPLGQTYNRRLSITEMVASSIPALATGLNFERSDVVQRRQRAGIVASGQSKEPIPLVTLEESAELQYRVPQAHITRYLLPSYSKHLAVEYSGPGRRVTGVKIYRLEHRIMPTQQFVLGGDPFHPATYKPYFYGDYDANGKLLNPQDEMLYWLVPNVPKRGGASPADPEKKDYVDYLSRHAGFEFDWGRMRP
jgi:hypothetical protein